MGLFLWALFEFLRRASCADAEELVLWLVVVWVDVDCVACCVLVSLLPP